MEKSSRRWVLVIVLITLILGLRSYSKQAMPPHPFFDGDRPLVIAHRGGAGIRPENTLIAFRHAARIGADVLELDVRLSSDNVLIVLHDETVDRTTDGSGKVDAMTWNEIQLLDAAYHWLPDDAPDDALPSFRGEGVGIPKLSEVLQEFEEQRFNIEIKAHSAEAAEALCRQIIEHQFSSKVLVASEKASTIIQFREHCPMVATGTSFSETLGFFLNQKIGLLGFYQPRAKALEVPVEAYGIELVTAKSTEAANRQGQHVLPWTINDQDEMRRLLDMGVSGLITDYPDRMLAVLADKRAQ
ncbi:MAG: glycerophosphodiester phosphodiesterase [Pseudomonadales bacterium]